MNRPRCIFCKKASHDSRSVEHIVPESLGNNQHVLPAGVVCDACNNYFAVKIEQIVLNSGHFTSLRHVQAIRNKRGNVPPSSALLVPGGVVKIFRETEGTKIQVPTHLWHLVESGESKQLWIPNDGPMPDAAIMSRFLAKMGLESLAFRILSAHLTIDELIDDGQLNPVREWARFAKGTKNWIYHTRRIYPPGVAQTGPDGDTYQMLHEFDFLLTETSELYYVIAIFGMEYTINLGGPYVDGYVDWLTRNAARSPLYMKKGQ